MFAFSGCPPSPIMLVMNAVTLPPDLEHFADEAVAKGRYRDVDEVVRAGITMLREAEAEVGAFVASLEAAQAEGERDGFFTIDEVAAELDSIIAEAERAQA